MNRRANNANNHLAPKPDQKIRAPDILKLLKDEKSSELSHSIIFEENM